MCRCVNQYGLIMSSSCVQRGYHDVLTDYKPSICARIFVARVRVLLHKLVSLIGRWVAIIMFTYHVFIHCERDRNEIRMTWNEILTTIKSLERDGLTIDKTICYWTHRLCYHSLSIGTWTGPAIINQKSLLVCVSHFWFKYIIT